MASISTPRESSTCAALCPALNTRTRSLRIALRRKWCSRSMRLAHQPAQLRKLSPGVGCERALSEGGQRRGWSW